MKAVVLLTMPLVTVSSGCTAAPRRLGSVVSCSRSVS